MKAQMIFDEARDEVVAVVVSGVPVVSVLAVLVLGVVVEGGVVVSGVVDGVVSAGSVRAVSSARLHPASTASDNAAERMAILLGFICRSPMNAAAYCSAKLAAGT